MRGKLRRWWPVVKALVCLVILVFIGRQFAPDLVRPELWHRPLHAGWLLLSGLLYLAGIGLSACYWGRLLSRLGHPTSVWRVARAYYLGHLGKYVPGKAWALLLRAWLVHGAGVPPGLAGLTAFYEVLTTMCAGAILATFLFALCGLRSEAGPGPSAESLVALLRLQPLEGQLVNRWTAAALALLLAVATGVPLWPTLFNRLAPRLALPGHTHPEHLPRLRLSHLLEGLFLTLLGWLLLGASVGVCLLGVVGPTLALTPLFLARVTAAVALAYVAGFIVLVAPSGLGVREFFLTLLLAPELAAHAGLDADEARKQVVLTVVVLRLVWTLAELLLAGALPRARASQPRPGPGADISREVDVISVVIPVYNERESLPLLTAELAAVAARAGLTLEVVFVDDGSRDGSWAVICDLARQRPLVRGIRFRRNFGKAAALSAGFRNALGDVILTLDADLQDDPAEIPRFLAALEHGSAPPSGTPDVRHEPGPPPTLPATPPGALDVVSGWKRVRHDPWHKVGPSRIFNQMVSSLTGVALHDHNCGMKCYRAEVVREVRLYGELHRFIPVLAAARGFRVGEIEINHRARRFGSSKYGVRRFVKGFLDLLTVKFLTGFGQRPQHLLGTLGLLSFLVGNLVLFGLAFDWLGVRLGWWNDIPLHQRPLLTYSVAALLLGAQMMSIGFLAELITAYQSRDEDNYSVAGHTPLAEASPLSDGTVTATPASHDSLS